MTAAVTQVAAKEARFEVAVGRQHVAQRSQHRLGNLDDALGEGIEKVGPAGLQEKAGHEQEACDFQQEPNDEIDRAVHLYWNPSASSRDRRLARPSASTI